MADSSGRIVSSGSGTAICSNKRLDFAFSTPHPLLLLDKEFSPNPFLNDVLSLFAEPEKSGLVE
jgi:hypothetical protein